MAFYLRKGINFGPIRFNLSKSGVGMSLGVTGLRLGMGPRGTYVHAGRGGLYYRKSLSSAGRRRASTSRSAPRAPSATEPAEFIDSAQAADLTPSSHVELCAEMQARRAKRHGAQWFALFAVLTFGLCLLPGVLHGAGLPSPWELVVGWGLTFPAAGVLVAWSWRKRATLLFYDLEGEVEPAWRQTWEAFRAWQGAAGLWSVDAVAHADERTRHGDAEVPAARTPVRVREGSPPWLRANTSLLQLGAGRQTLLLTPDALLVLDPDGGVGAIPWIDVEIHADALRVREPGPPPADAEVVDRTWTHTRKDGQPDRRFRDNPPVAICHYGVLHLRSPGGLDERFHLSQPALALDAAHALRALQAALDLPEAS